MKKIFFAAGPWPSILLYWTLVLGADWSSLRAAVAASLYAVGYSLVAMGAKRITKLDYGVVLFWICGITLGLSVTSVKLPSFEGHFGSLLYLFLFGAAYLPVACGLQPFTVPFAERRTPEMFWNTDAFRSVNRIMTLVWAGLFLVALLITLIPSFWTQVPVPLLVLLGAGIPFTKKFPALYLKAQGLGDVSNEKQVQLQPQTSGLQTGSTIATETSQDEFRRKKAQELGAIQKALVVFGSPRGEKGFTFKALDRFLDGIRTGGIEPEVLFLNKYKIRPCTGCYTCWSKTPGVCIHKDDMPGLLEKVRDVDLVIYAQPLYVFSVPGITKNFLDRQIPLLEPHLIERPDGSTGHPARYNGRKRRRMLLFSVCGFPEKDHFDALTGMFRLMSRAGGTPIIGEILRPSSESMRFGERMGKNYELVMDALYRAGQEVMTQGYVAKRTEEAISAPFLPDHRNLRQLGNRFWDTWIHYERKKAAGQELPDIETYLADDKGMYFEGMAAMYDPSRAGDFEGTFQFHIDGDRSYYLEIKDRSCRAEEGEAAKAEVVVHTPLAIWQAIGNGEISGQQALMEGKYRVEGDLGLLIKMGSIFSP